MVETEALGDGVLRPCTGWSSRCRRSPLEEQPGPKVCRDGGSYIAAVEVPAGQGCFAGLRYHTGKPTTLALVLLGYADGAAYCGRTRWCASIRARRTWRTAALNNAERVDLAAWLVAPLRGPDGGR